MKLRIALLVLSLGIIACMSTDVARKPITTAVPVDYLRNKQLFDTSQTPILSTVPDKFYVNVELTVFQDEIDLYPETWKQLQKALSEWSGQIPVRWIVLTEDSSLALSVYGRLDAIEIHLADLQGDGYGFPEGLLGLWESNSGSVLIDADYLENNADQAYSVSLHEIGHMFGVPHIIGFDELGYTGYVVLPEGYDATNFVMYPRATSKNPQKTLSWIEIELARNNLLHHWTRPDVSYKLQEDCKHF